MARSAKKSLAKIIQIHAKYRLQRMPRTRLFKVQSHGEFPWTVLSIFMAGQFIVSIWL
jgi:hypothetical protein